MMNFIISTGTIFIVRYIVALCLVVTPYFLKYTEILLSQFIYFSLKAIRTLTRLLKC